MLSKPKYFLKKAMRTFQIFWIFFNRINIKQDRIQKRFYHLCQDSASKCVLVYGSSLARCKTRCSDPIVSVQVSNQNRARVLSNATKIIKIGQSILILQPLEDTEKSEMKAGRISLQYLDTKRKIVFLIYLA